MVASVRTLLTRLATRSAMWGKGVVNRMLGTIAPSGPLVANATANVLPRSMLTHWDGGQVDMLSRVYMVALSRRGLRRL